MSEMSNNRGRVIVVLGGLACLMGLAVAGAAGKGTPKMADGQTQRWEHVDRVGSYSFDGGVIESKDISGIACISPTRGLIGADESGVVQVIELSRETRRLKVLQSIALVNTAEEVDIEAIAAGGDAYYIVGSHGVAKKTGARQASRYKIFRLRVDRATGMPLGGGDALTVASLTNILKSNDTLKWYFGKPLQQKGLNIEGLAVRQGQLFVGLRNPNLGGHAFVLEVGADDVFADVKRPAYTLHKLMLGEGLGIREIVAARSGFLLIAGNAGSEPSDVFRVASDYEKDRGYWLFHWDGPGGAVEKIGQIPAPPGKAESMIILDELPEQATVLILFDGPKKGQPSVYRLH